MTNIENSIKGVLIIALVLLGVTFPEWGHLVRPMLTLFDDVIAIGLLGLVLVLVTWYDCKLGLAFFVLVAFVLFNRQDISGVVEGFLASMENTSSTPTALSRELAEKAELERLQAQERAAMAAKAVESASQAQENNARAAQEAKAQEQREADKSAAEARKAEQQASNQKAIAKKDTKKVAGLKSAMPVLASGAKEEKARRAGRKSRFADIEGFTSGTVGFKNLLHPNTTPKVSFSHTVGVYDKSRLGGSPCEASREFNTYIGTPEYPGYDVAGGRFDFVNSTQNMTIHGPPLSWCPTYTSSVSKLPTPFYPLNA